MHYSGRMLLALYANGVLRLWNMLDARCLFKFKTGMSADQDSEAEAEEEYRMEYDADAVEEEKDDIEAQKNLKSEETRKVLKQFDKLSNKAVQVMWEPTKG